jgi:DNA replication protein DnaC
MVKGLILENPEQGRKLDKNDMYRMNIGPRFWQCTFDKIPDKCSHKLEFKKWLSNITSNLNKGIGLLISGDYGAGKTSLAVIAMKNTAIRKGSAIMIRGNQLRQGIIQDEDSEDTSLRKRVSEVDLLVLDDLGSEHETAFGNSVLEEILRERYDNKKATIITTNLSKEALIAKLGESMISFLSASTVHIICSGHDFRQLERDNIREDNN